MQAISRQIRLRAIGASQSVLPGFSGAPGSTGRGHVGRWQALRPGCQQLASPLTAASPPQ
uniref:Uncharacterized protein n=1 Tax=Ralstonia solanacearum TaxID=305 RepID=A0A0S4UY23_RALSL|nr:protein of unknown function [Ralstonia solanacearum]